MAHQIPDQILRIVQSERIVIRLYSLAMNPNTNKPIDIQVDRILMNSSISVKKWDQTICKFS